MTGIYKTSGKIITLQNAILYEQVDISADRELANLLKNTGVVFCFNFFQRLLGARSIRYHFSVTGAKDVYL